MIPKKPTMTMLIVAGNDIDYLKILIALMIPKTSIMTMLIVDGNDVDYLKIHRAPMNSKTPMMTMLMATMLIISTKQLLAPVVKALDLVAEKSCGSQGGKNAFGEIWIISKCQS